MPNDIAILKSFGCLLALPLVCIIIFALLLTGVSKIAFYWQEATFQKKDKLSLWILLTIIANSMLYTALNPGNDHGHLVALSFLLLATHIHFSQKELRHQGGHKSKILSEQKHEAFILGFKGALKSKGYWGITVITLAVICLISIQFTN